MDEKQVHNKRKTPLHLRSSNIYRQLLCIRKTCTGCHLHEGNLFSEVICTGRYLFLFYLQRIHLRSGDPGLEIHPHCQKCVWIVILRTTTIVICFCFWKIKFLIIFVLRKWPSFIIINEISQLQRWTAKSIQYSMAEEKYAKATLARHDH